VRCIASSDREEDISVVVYAGTGILSESATRTVSRKPDTGWFLRARNIEDMTGAASPRRQAVATRSGAAALPIDRPSMLGPDAPIVTPYRTLAKTRAQSRHPLPRERVRFDAPKPTFAPARRRSKIERRPFQQLHFNTAFGSLPSLFSSVGRRFRS
jgi:hypothetical protein